MAPSGVRLPEDDGEDLQHAPAGRPSGRTAGPRAIARRNINDDREILSEDCAMKVTVTARHAKFTDSLKEAAAAKAQHLEHFFDHLKKCSRCWAFAAAASLSESVNFA